MTNRRARCIGLLALGVIFIASLRVSSAEQLNSVRGIALTALRQPLIDHFVRLRSLDTVRAAKVGRTSSTGAYEFNSVEPGNYYVEILDRANRIVSTDGPIAVSSGGGERQRAVRIAVVSAAAASIGAITVGTLRPGSVNTPQSGAPPAIRGSADEVVIAATRAGITDGVIAARPLPSAPR